jgi:hypothetical protein
MNNFKNISNDLKAFFSNNHIFKTLLPIDVIFLFGGVVVMLLNQFVGVGSLLYSLAYYLFFLGVLLTIANYKLDSLYIAFFTYAGIGVLRILSGLFYKYGRYLNYDAIMICLIFGGLGYLIFRISGAEKQNSK